MKRLLPSSLVMCCLLVYSTSNSQVRSQQSLLRQVLYPAMSPTPVNRAAPASLIPRRATTMVERPENKISAANPKNEQIGSLNPEINTNFEGNNFHLGNPSSNSVAISNTGWIIAVVNNSISYYDEFGNIALDSEPLSDFYSYLDLSGPIYNPQVVFDPVAERFIFAALHGTNLSSTRLIVSFSFSQDPADGWWSYSFDNIAEEPDRWMGQMRIGISAKDLYVTGKLFAENDDEYLSAILQIHKGTGYQGENLGYNYWSDIQDEDNNQVGTLIPVSDGYDTGYGPGIYFLGAKEEGGNTLQFFEVTGDSDQGPFLSGYYYEYPAYSPGQAGEQASSNVRLEVGGCQIQSAFISSDILHFAHHSSLTDGSNGIRYAELDLAAETLSYIELGGEGQSSAYPSITPFQLKSPEIRATLLHYSQSSSSGFPSTYVLTLDQDLNPSYPLLVKGGESSIISVEGQVPWGRYSGITRRHNAEIPTAWVFGSFGKEQGYGNWLAEITPLGEGLNWPCQNAELVSCGSTIGGSTAVNPQVLPACIESETNFGGQWYRLVGHGGNVILSTCNNKTDFDTRILVFTGNCSDLNCLEVEAVGGCTLNTENADQVFYAIDGDEYFIYVTARGDQGGTFEMTVSCEDEEGTCTGEKVLTECAASLVDGSGEAPYSNDLACSWTITPYAAATITLNFSEFAVEDGFDYVSIYDGNSTNDTLIAQFTGNNIPPEVVAKTGKMHILFESDGSFTEAGWLANYSCTLQQTPIVDFAADTLFGITPFTVSFTNLTDNLPADFLWDFGDGNTSTSPNPSHTYTEAGIYSVRLTATNLAGEDTKIISNYIVVEPNVIAPETNFTQDEACGTFPLTVNFEDLSNNQPTSWQWDFGNGETSDQQDPTVTYTEAGIYTVKLMTSNEAGQDELVLTSLITVIGPVEISATDGTGACLGTALPLQATGAERYNWAGQGLSSNTDSLVSAAPTIAGDYLYMVTGTTNGCTSAPDTITLSFVPVPLVSISASSTITCIGQAIKLIGSGADSYSWEGVGLTDNEGSQVLANPILPGSYTYELIGIESGCSSPSQAITLLFNSVPDVSLSPRQAEICAGDSIRLVASGGGIYTWQGPGLESFEQSEVWVKPEEGTITYRVSSTVNGCQSEEQMSSITINPSPTVSLVSAPTTICLGDTLVLISAGAESYQWNGPNMLAQQSDSLFAQPIEIGSVAYELTGFSNGCPSEALLHSLEVKNNELSVSIEANNCPGPNLVFQAVVNNGGMTGDEILWFLNEEEVATGTTYSLSDAQNGDQIYCTARPIDPLACTSPAQASSNIITIDCLTVDTKEPNTWSAVQLLPNPNAGQFLLSFTHQIRQNLQIDVYNTLGQLIYRQSIEAAPGHQDLPVDIQQQSEGLYWLVISSATERQTLSFLKQ